MLERYLGRRKAALSFLETVGAVGAGRPDDKEGAPNIVIAKPTVRMWETRERAFLQGLRNRRALFSFALLAVLSVGFAASWPSLGSDLQGLPAFTVSLATDKPAYQPGQPIRITFEVVNRGDKTVGLDFSSAQRFDVAIENAGGNQVWRWSAGRMFAQMLGQEILGPERRSLTYEATGAVSATLGIEVR